MELRRRTAATGCLMLAAVATLAACGTSAAGITGAASAAASSGARLAANASAPGQVAAAAAAAGGRAVMSPAADQSPAAGPAGQGAPSGQAGLPPGKDAPAGFWYGTDSWPVPVSGAGPYRLAPVDGSYGGYVGMAGNWARWQGCSAGNFLAWSGTNARQAAVNFSRYGAGIGTAVYWYMGGPGVDPHWNGSTKEAAAWGAVQAAHAIADADADKATYPVLFMDIEMPGIAPAPDNGWSVVYTSPCSGAARSGQHVSPALSRAEFNGFDDYLTAHSRFKAGVYSDPAIWQQIFGTGPDSRIPHTYEWTYEPETASLAAAPHGWCLPGRGASGCAQFFGDVAKSSQYAVMWQWSGGGGVRNPIGDFDQIDAAIIR